MVQQPTNRVERRLSAILAADVAGYSRLMHNDEETTHARLSMLLTDAVEPSIAQHGGRVVKNTGDGLLAEFRSAVEAVRAAMQFQERVHDLTIGDAEDKRLAFRVGINIGDVIVEAHDIFGDGVNIAARLEGIAEPGGICISSSAYDQVLGKVVVEFTDLGEQSLKNIARPVRAYAVVRKGSGGPARTGGETPGPHSVRRLSIVVLPFANLGGDPEQDYFVDGITENLTTDLSRISGSFVIARNTAFSFKGKMQDVRQIGRELNVRYVLEGSVQRSGKRLRVNAQLIDVETGNHLWAERFDKPITDLFDMQDEIVSRLANTLNTQLIAAEARRAERSLHADTLDLIFQGAACLHRGLTHAHMTQARGFYERALALEPTNVRALVGIAAVETNYGATMLTDDRDARFAAAETALKTALSLVPNSASARSVLGFFHILTNRAALGIAECERALALDRNLAGTHGLIGLAKVLLGRGAETETHILEALRLSPRDSRTHYWMYWVGIAKSQLGDDIEAVIWFRRSIEANRNFPLAHFTLAATLALIGELAEAQLAAQAGVELDPGFTVSRIRAGLPSNNPAYIAGFERLCEGGRMAGVPEG